MIYRSNLSAPDLAPHFDLHPQPIQLLGHDMPSDRVFDPNCGFWTHDEAAILYTTAKANQGWWVDIGSRMGWTSAHLMAAGCDVVAVDHEYTNAQFVARALANVQSFRGRKQFLPYLGKSEQFFECSKGLYNGFVIDGDHDSPVPFDDALGAMCFSSDNGVILFHDFWGRPIREAVERVMACGWHCRVYMTPNGVAACWRGQAKIPMHAPDPRIDWRDFMHGRAPEFDFGRCV